MGFWSVLKKVGTVGLAVSSSPLVRLIPGAGQVAAGINMAHDIVTKIQGDVINAEIAHPEPGKGVEKAAAVINDFDEWFGASAELANQALALRGEKLTYDAALLTQVVSMQADLLNLYAKLKESVKIVKVEAQ